MLLTYLLNLLIELMKKYIHLVLFPLLLSILWVLFIEYFHVFQNASRVYHWTLIFPLLFLLWATVLTKEHRVMFRALGYMFRHHSKELIWHEIFETLEGRQSEVMCLLSREYKTSLPHQKWKRLWTDADRNLVDINNATKLACQQMVNYYMTEHATMEQKRIYRKWKTGGSSDIYIVAAFLNVL